MIEVVNDGDPVVRIGGTWRVECCIGKISANGDHILQDGVSGRI